MSDVLVKRLRMKDEYLPLGHDGWEAADRIEELTAERDEALNQLDSARHSVDVLERRLTYKLTKLAKAVEALEEIMGDGDAMGCNPQLKADIASATLAELKGKSDE